MYCSTFNFIHLIQVILSYSMTGVICDMDNCLTFPEKSDITIHPNDNED